MEDGGGAHSSGSSGYGENVENSTEGGFWRRTTCGVEFVVLGGWITRCGRWCGRYDDV